MNFQHCTVVITGATRGIGAALAEAFGAAGAGLIITGTSDKAPDGFTGIYHQLNLCDKASVELFATFLRDQAAIDVLINNAGINIIKPIEEMTASEFERVAAVNTLGPFILTQAVVSGMKRQKSGRIVNIGSIWSVVTKPMRTAYSAAKSGLAGLTRAQAAELGGSGILVNTVSPGFTLTDLTARSLSAVEKKSIENQIPLRRMALPSEIAQVVMFLASRQNTYLTGQNIVVDGGFSII